MNPDSPSSNYCDIPVKDSIFSQVLAFDVFVKISEEKFIKIGHAKETLDEEQRQRFLEKGVDNFYILKNDFRKIVDFNLNISLAMSVSNTISIDKKKRFLVGAGETILQNTFVMGLDEQTFRDSKTFLLQSLDILTDDLEVFSLLESMNQRSETLYTHSLAVSLYSVMMAKAIGWNSKANLFKLSFGALMHDIGKKDFSPELMNKPKGELTFTEKAQLEGHSQKSKEILEGLSSVPNEAVMIAYQHHEHRAEGYPQKLAGRQIHPMAKIVNVANEFCGYAIGPHAVPDITFGHALHLMEQYKKDQLDPEFFNVLKALAIRAAA